MPALRRARGGGAEENLSGSVGHGDLKTDRYNIALGFNFDHMSPIMGASRAFAQRYSPAYGNDVTSSFAFPANVAIPGVGTSQSQHAELRPRLALRHQLSEGSAASTTRSSTRCSLSSRSSISTSPPRWPWRATTSCTARRATHETKTTTFVQPVPLSYQNPLLPGNPYIAYLANLLATQYPTYNNPAVQPGDGAFLLPPTSPYYPAAFAAANGQAGQPLNLIYRDFANGDRKTLDTADTYRVVGGIKGNVAGWDYDGAALYSEIKVHEDLESGFALYSKIMPLLDTGTINPFGPTSDPAALAAAKDTEFTGQDFASKTSLASLAGTASREIMPLPAGKLSVAVGAELRHETFEFDPAAAIQTGDVTGQGGNQLPENASRNVESAFAEVYADLLTGLSADAAVRYDNYQTGRQHREPEGFTALAAGAVDPVPRLGGHRLPGAVAHRPVCPADDQCHLERHARSDQVPGVRSEQSGVQLPVHHRGRR